MRSARTSPRAALIGNLMLVLFGTLVGLLLGEIGARIAAYSLHQQKLADWRKVQEQPAVPPTGRVSFGQIIRRSSNPRVIYELIPDLRGVEFQGAPLEVNAHGFRGPGYPSAKAAGVFRIVGIGDSVMFGWGVEERASYLRVLERKLELTLPTREFQTINMAVPGYNTAMEVALLEEKGVAFEPDLVILGFVGNDLALPNLIRSEDMVDYLSLTQSFLLEYLVDSGVFQSHLVASGLVVAPEAAQGRGFASDPRETPKRYRYMVGEAGVIRALRQLDRLRGEEGFGVLITAHGEAPEFLRTVCEELGFDLLEIRPLVRQYQTQHGIREYMGSALTISATDPHPSVLQHRLHGDAIHARLLDNPALLGLSGQY